MFINIDSVNYYVHTEDKSLEEIVNELIGRMNIKFMAPVEYEKFYHKVKNQLV
jgi:hypothetical protein